MMVGPHLIGNRMRMISKLALSMDRTVVPLLFHRTASHEESFDVTFIKKVILAFNGGNESFSFRGENLYINQAMRL
jgi:hypothetical protein